MLFRFLAALLAAALAVGGAVVVIGPTTALEERALVVEIPPHLGVTAIARHLQVEGAVRSAWAAVAVAAVHGAARRLKAGEYEFPRGASTIDVVRMLESGRVRQHPVLHPEGATVRELAVPEEQRLIAAVFWKRLQLDMPLQADPTVQYALAKERRTLTRADLATDNPFNTYRNPGLPPGPIASPGMGAIEAALDPAPVKYLYFVAVSADGRRHHFSTTVEEHNAAVARYRLSRH